MTVKKVVVVNSLGVMVAEALRDMAVEEIVCAPSPDPLIENFLYSDPLPDPGRAALKRATASKYTPHQGSREMARRKRQLARRAALEEQEK